MKKEKLNKDKTPVHKTRARSRNVDWPAIRKEYVAGQLSLEEIGKLYDVTKQAIHEQAKKYKWPRDPKELIRKRIQEKLLDENLTQEAVDLAADRGASIILTPRRDGFFFRSRTILRRSS